MTRFPGPVAQSTGTSCAVSSSVKMRERMMNRWPVGPSIENPASNAVCRKLGFTFVEKCQVEYPPGRSMIVNDWQLDLFAT